jgi:hypothetical protein
MISYTRTHILSTVSSVSCCVVAYVATEPETVFTDDFFTKPHVLDAGEIAGIWEPSERENAGKCDRIGASHSHLREEPPKRPPSDGGCLRTTLDVSGYFDAIFWQDFSAFPAISLMQWTSVDVLERYWMVGRVGIEPTTN